MKRVGIVLVLVLSTTAASAMTYFLKEQWMNGANRMCRYSNGTVLNVGVNLCPLSIEG